MAYVLFALLLFCVSVMMHIFYCRNTSRPGLQAKAYIFIAILCLGVYTLGALIIQHSALFPAPSFWGLPFKATSAVIFVLLVPVYLCFYVLTQLVSPSKKILLSISRQGRLSYAGILLSVKEEDFINTRLNDLITSGCVRQAKGGYQLSMSGRKIAGVLKMMQFMLGREIGG